MEKGSKLNVEERLKLSEPFQIWTLNKSFSPLQHPKSPGPDGYSSTFFKAS